LCESGKRVRLVAAIARVLDAEHDRVVLVLPASLRACKRGTESDEGRSNDRFHGCESRTGRPGDKAMIKRRAQMGGPQRNQLGCGRLRPASRLEALPQMPRLSAGLPGLEPHSLMQIQFSAEKKRTFLAAHDGIRLPGATVPQDRSVRPSI